jgi:outer membrane autotransporter protein
MAIVQFYPAVASGFFLKGGVGISRLTTSLDDGAFSFNTSDNGLGLTAGLGYDFRLGTNFSLGPYGSFAWGNFDGGTANHFQGGLSGTLH